MPADLNECFRVDPADLPDEAVIFGGTAAMDELRGKIGCVLDSDLPVLLQGEGGTGKDLVARYLHSRSSRRGGPFVKLSCAAFPRYLLEGELLGYEERAASGGGEGKPGLVEMAEGGTLFLDEIAEMGWTLQRRLLLLLQGGRYFRVGGHQERQASVRIVCATNVDLVASVKRGAFRRDLFDHMEVLCFRLPALRARKMDIPLLWDFFADKLAGKFGKSAPLLTPAILRVLEQWDWPGNLCELENCIARVMILGDEQAIGEELRRQAALANAADLQTAGITQPGIVLDQATGEATVLQAPQASLQDQRKTAGPLKRSYRPLLYRLRSTGGLKRPRSRKRFPRSG
jgi:Nif-specific regulatory protein